MLAIERLRRINSGQYKPPPPVALLTDGYRGSHELLDPRHHGYRYMDGSQRGVSPGSPGGQHSPQTPSSGGGGEFVLHKPPRSPSMDNLIHRGNGNQALPVDASNKIYASRDMLMSSSSSTSSSPARSSHYQVPSIQVARHGSSSSMGSSHAGQLYAAPTAQDIVAIQVNRQQSNTTPTPDTEQNGAISSDAGGHTAMSVQSTHSSFHSPTRVRHASGPGAGTELSTFEQGGLLTAEHADHAAGTLKRPSAKVSPILKPKPIATIVAKSPRNSPLASDMSKSSESAYSRFNGHAAGAGRNYSSGGSLPRNASMRNQLAAGSSSKSSASRAAGEHIYDLPASSVANSQPAHTPLIRPSLGSAPSSPHHSASFFGAKNSNGAVAGKKAPPPPPKRTNSIKHGGKSHLPSKPVHPALRKASASSVDTTDSQSAHSDDELPAQPPPQAMPLLSNNYALLDRFGGARANSVTGSGAAKANDTVVSTSAATPQSNANSLATSAISTSAGSRVNGTASHNAQSTARPFNCYAQAPAATTASVPQSPLSDAIQQLQFNASGLSQRGAAANSRQQTASAQLQQQPQQLQTQPGTVQDSSSRSSAVSGQKPVLAEKPKNPRVSGWQERDVDSGSGSGSDSDSSRQSTLKRCAGAGGTGGTGGGTGDSNTLPFANENVGTIKQRSAAAKPSIVSVSSSEGDAGGDDSRHVELNASVFDDSGASYHGAGTLKRLKKPGSDSSSSSSAMTSSSQHQHSPAGERSLRRRRYAGKLSLIM